MSEYYQRGRAVFADATSLAFFVLGFLGAGPFAWPALRTAFENGQYDKGLAVFIARIFGSGVAVGAVGYVLGALAGRLWQAIHQWRRARRQPVVVAGQDAARMSPVAVETSRDASADEPAEAQQRAPRPMSCRVGPLTPSNVAAFSRRLGDGGLDRRFLETTSTETVTLTAWDGLDIAGVARLMSDGYGTLVITDFVIDPYYARTDVEDRLIAFALERVPANGRLTRL